MFIFVNCRKLCYYVERRLILYCYIIVINVITFTIVVAYIYSLLGK